MSESINYMKSLQGYAFCDEEARNAANANAKNIDKLSEEIVTDVVVKDYQYTDLPAGKKLTIYSDDRYDHAPVVFLGKNYWPDAPYVSEGYLRHGLSMATDGHNFTMRGIATVSAYYDMVPQEWRNNWSDVRWPIPDGLAAGDSIDIHLYADKHTDKRTNGINVTIFDSNKTQLAYYPVRISDGENYKVTKNKAIPEGAAYFVFSFPYSNGGEYDRTVHPVIVKSGTQIISDLAFEDGKCEVTLEAESDYVYTAPYKSSINEEFTFNEYNAMKQVEGESEIKNIVTPEMFGAYGDGKHDDTEALQACVDHAVSEGKKMIGGGYYYISKSLTISGSILSIDIRHVGYSGSDCAVIVSGAQNNIRIGVIYALRSDASAAGFRLNSGADGALTQYNEIYLGRVYANGNAVEYISSAYNLLSNNLTFGQLQCGSEYCCIYHSPFQQELDGGVCHGNNNFTGGHLVSGKWGVYNARHQDTYMTCRFENVDKCIHQGGGGVVRVIAPRYVEIVNRMREDGKGVLYEISDLPYEVIPSNNACPPYHYFTLDGASLNLTVWSINIANMVTRIINEDGEIVPISKNVPGSNTIYEQIRDNDGEVVGNSFMLFGDHILIKEPYTSRTKHINVDDVGYTGVDYRITKTSEEFQIYDTYVVDASGCTFTLPPSYDSIAFNKFTVIQSEGTDCTFKDWRGTTIFEGANYGAGVYQVHTKMADGYKMGNYDNEGQIWEIRRMSDYSLVDTMPHEEATE